MFPLMERNIPHVGDKILSYLDIIDLAASSLMCREWSSKVTPLLNNCFGPKQRENGRVPLIHAVELGHVDLVAHLVKDHELDVNESSGGWLYLFHFNYGPYGKACTPLLLAVDRGYEVIHHRSLIG